ncbi:MAG: hypothetical protein UV95_C0001G0144 [Candidatus Falkowbacteria bacterium GW2011_GWF2_43_32]|nr:MAG: hypothetical protein UV95_C0001G0144 [Candidatus Falkowbacteria bacterium GW2011_GWF2_43_32]
MENNSKKIWIILGVAVVIILIIIVAISQSKKAVNPGEINQPTDATTAEGEIPLESEEMIEVNTVLQDARVEVPGANPITKDNKVVTLEGKPTANDVSQSSSEAPGETGPVAKEELSASVIKLDVSTAGFSPKEFEVKTGAPITIAITSVDSYVHSFVFEDPSLSAIGIGVYSGETRAVTFNAPDKAGEYAFFCNVGGHKGRGETGKMIVK